MLGGICAPESFALSQAFYFGAVASNPDHRAEIIEGDFIDLRDDLDAGAIGSGKPHVDVQFQESVFDIEPTGKMNGEVERLLAEPLARGQRSTRFAHAVKLAVEVGMTARDLEVLCRANPQGCARKYLPPERRDELRKRIAELWAPHVALMAERDALGKKSAAQILAAHAAKKTRTA